MATLFETDGEEREVQPRNGVEFKLEELQEFVGGYIEIVHPQDRHRNRGRILVVNEEGKLLGLPFNARASEVFSAPFDVIVGPALLCKDSEVR